MIDFQVLYRSCLRGNHLGKSSEDLQKFLDATGSTLTVEEHTVSSFKSIDGYSIQVDSCRAFFPKNPASALQNKSNLDYIRKQFLKADFVTPPFMKNNFLLEFAKAIDNAFDSENIAEEFGARMYDIEGISAYIVDIYNKNSDFEKYSLQINEAIEAFCFGLNRVAITSLVPCIEGIVRDIGIKIGLACEDQINIHQFLKIIEALQKRVISDLVFYGFDWVPSDFKSVALHDGFNEQIQMLESLKVFLKNSLYQHTTSYQGRTNLNRHGIVHGFITDFNSRGNFYRLITVLNLLYVCSVLSGNNGSLFHPEACDESRAVESRLSSIVIFKVALNRRA